MEKLELSGLITKRRVKLIVPALVFLVLTIAVTTFINNMNGPAEGVISQTPSPATIKNKTKTAVQGKYDGKYVSFSYPEYFGVTPSPKDSGFLEAVNLYSNDHSGKQVAIGILRESLANDSGANYRQAHPGIYKKQSDLLGNLVYSKDKNGSEYTGFLVHNDFVASVSLSSTYTKDLSADYKEFIKNWQWKQ